MEDLPWVWCVTILACHREKSFSSWITETDSRATGVMPTSCESPARWPAVLRMDGEAWRLSYLDIKILVLGWKILQRRIRLCHLRAEGSTPNWEMLQQTCTESRNLSAPEVKPGETLQLLCIQARFPSLLKAAWRSSASLRQFHLVSLLLFAAVLLSSSQWSSELQQRLYWQSWWTLDPEQEVPPFVGRRILPHDCQTGFMLLLLLMKINA